MEALVIRMAALAALLWAACASEAVPASAAAAPAAVVSAPPPVLPTMPAPTVRPSVPVDRALFLLQHPKGCASAPDAVECGLRSLYEGHPAELSDALALYAEFGDVAGLDEGGVLDGGFRGDIELVPERPVGEHAHLLRDVLAAQRSTAAFFASVAAKAPSPVAFRHTGIGWRFFRSVGRKTPSALASGFEVALNVDGSLLGTPLGVEETLIHEGFHNNDGDDWSRRVLGATVDGIVAKCGTSSSCLGPYSPGTTTVKGGTYYAFQPDNGDHAHEYGAELALRYVRETRAALAGAPVASPFRCGPPENRLAWDAWVARFVGGFDLTPACAEG